MSENDNCRSGGMCFIRLISLYNEYLMIPNRNTQIAYRPCDIACQKNLCKKPISSELHKSVKKITQKCKEKGASNKKTEGITTTDWGRQRTEIFVHFKRSESSTSLESKRFCSRHLNEYKKLTLFLSICFRVRRRNITTRSRRCRQPCRNMMQ